MIPCHWWLFWMATAWAYTFNITYAPWPEVLDRQDVALRLERDLTRPVPINLLSHIGINLTLVVFAKSGVSLQSMTEVLNLLTTGVQAYTVNLYWNEFSEKWQLCPVPYDVGGGAIDSLWDCSVDITVNDLLREFSNYCLRTNTEWDSTVLRMTVRLYDIPKRNTLLPVATDVAVGNNSLAASFAPMKQWMYTPFDLDNVTANASHYVNVLTFPTFDTFVLTDLKRMIVSVDQDHVSNMTHGYNFTDADKQLLFTSLSTASTIIYNANPELLEQCRDINNGSLLFTPVKDALYYITDYGMTPFTQEEVNNYLRCGFSPLLSNITLVSAMEQFYPFGFWLWSAGQPVLSGERFLTDQGNNDPIEAYNCVALYEGGYAVSDCYNQYYYACQLRIDGRRWHVSPKDDKRSYFDGYKDDVCPNGYEFLIPRLPWDLQNLNQVLLQQQIDFPIWVDMNEITVPDCFVTGGPYAQCPYKRVFTRKQLVKLIAPSFVVSAFLLLLVILEKFVRLNPIQTNRKAYWRRVINEFNENHDYEGVPS